MKMTITNKEAIRRHYAKERDIIEKTAMKSHKEKALEDAYKREAGALAKFDIEGGKLEVEQIGLGWEY